MTSVLATGSIFINAQTDLLEHIPTNEIAVISFDGKSLSTKSKDFNSLAIHDSIVTQFDRLLAEYKQALLDENTVVTDEEVEEIREEVEYDVPPPPPEPQIKTEIIEEEVEVPADMAYEEVETVEKAYDSYDYNYEYDYKPTPRLTLVISQVP